MMRACHARDPDSNSELGVKISKISCESFYDGMVLHRVMKPGHLVFLLFAIFIAGCLAPGGGPSPNPNATYTPTQLKYFLLDHYGEGQFFYCDPDYYPVGRGDEAERAVTIFPDIQNETEVFSAIIARKSLQPPYSNNTKLLIYREYKKLRAIPLALVRGDTYSFNLQIGTRGEGRQVSGIIRSDGTIIEERSEQAVLTCPICLSRGTSIDTPAGPVRVEEMQSGMPVWTPDADGNRRAVPVLLTIKTRVSPLHQAVHLRLSDGRELYASPGHPTMDGRFLGTLAVGDGLDGARVIGADLEPAGEECSYDILPAGETGGYWANGILLKSTLFEIPTPSQRERVDEGSRIPEK
jgi:hypothetical protein